MSANELFQESALHSAIYELERAKLAILLVLDNCNARPNLPSAEELLKWHHEVYSAELRLKTAASFCHTSAASLSKAQKEAAS